MTPSLRISEDETIEGAGRALREGRATCVGLLGRRLDAIDAWEPRVQAWTVVDRLGASEQARALDDELAQGRDRGPLHGIPVGVKDIIDVQGLPTGAGARRWSNGPSSEDARVVAHLRTAGAIILGKTVTTPYAFIDPPPTKNPWDLTRTPGGSSSGSAAAVATGMCLAAIGTQTAGSVTRPASYCGVASVKYQSTLYQSSGPGMAGILPLAPSLDTVGILARTVADLELLRSALIVHQAPNRTTPKRGDFPRLGRLRGFFEEMADPAMREAFNRAAVLFQEAGAEIVEIPWPSGFEKCLTAVRTIMAAECAAFHRARFEADPDDYPPRISDLILEGRSIPATDYIDAIRLRSTLRQALSQAILTVWSERIDALIVPGAIGPAPGLETTGSPAFNAPWNFVDCETISFPIGLSPEGLPLAIQFVATPFDDRPPTWTVGWCEGVIRAFFNPGRG